MDFHETALKMQSFNQKRNSITLDEIWFLEHYPVYSYGVSTDLGNLPNGLSHPLVKTDRGGKITYHAPGQILVYILMDYNRAGIKPKMFIKKFQSAIFKSISEFCKKAELNESESGIFFDAFKLASFGLKMTKKGSYHGASINHKMELNEWDQIVICGNPENEAKDLYSMDILVSKESLTGSISKNILSEFDSEIFKVS